MTIKRHNYTLTRREFVQASASVAAIVSSTKPWTALGSVPQRLFEYGNPLAQFRYGDVQFPPGLHQAQIEQTHAILMALDEDALLRPYRRSANLPAPGTDLGGWYSSSTFEAETFGQWISALSRYYAITGHEPTRAKVERLLEGLSLTLEPTGKIYKGSNDVGYRYNNLVCGLIDSYEFAKNDRALKILAHATEVIAPLLPGDVTDKLVDNNYSVGKWELMIPENQFMAWQRGGDPRHLELAEQYLDHEFFDPLSQGENVIGGRQAVSHVDALCSAAKAYLVLGEEKYLKAAVNGLSFVHQQSYATGGWGPNETFLPYKDEGDNVTGKERGLQTLGDSLAATRWHFETGCGSYGHFKLTRYLLRITKEAEYGDSMERVMYNTVLGALPLNQYGKAFYYADYHHHGHKSYYDGNRNRLPDEWPCCSGTLPQLAADYHVSTYFRDREGIFVNLYVPSTLLWDEQGASASLTQSGEYPLADEIALEVKISRPTRFAVRLRIPAWARTPAVRVNGKRIADEVRRGAFVQISREWKSGDRIELELPRTLELKPVDSQHPDVVALTCGPLVLFACADDTPKVTRAQLLDAKQQGRGSTEWRVEASSGPLRLVPFWAVKGETYFTYLSV